MTTAVWIDENASMQPAKLQRHGLTQPYFSHRPWAHAGGITADRLDAIAGMGFQPGIYTVVGNYGGSWYPELDPVQSARLLSDELKRINWKGNAPVCVDSETHDIGWVLAFFREWRRLRPTRATWFTFEGFQGGLFAPAVVAELVGMNLRFVPQLYKGDMTPQPLCPVTDLLIAGFPGDRIDPFYDGAIPLPYKWRGFVFTQARLP